MSEFPDITECAPYACTPAWSCPVHGPLSPAMIADGWSEPPGGWAAYDREVEERRAEALATRGEAERRRAERRAAFGEDLAQRMDRLAEATIRANDAMVKWAAAIAESMVHSGAAPGQIAEAYARANMEAKLAEIERDVRRKNAAAKRKGGEE